MSNYFDGMTDEQVQDFAEEVNIDLIIASETDNNSEWHEKCFAAMCITVREMNNRGIKRKDIK